MSFLPCYNLYHILFSFFFLPFIPSYLTHISFTFPVSHICRALRVLYFLFIYTTLGHRTTTGPLGGGWENFSARASSSLPSFTIIQFANARLVVGSILRDVWSAEQQGWVGSFAYSSPPFKTNKLELELILFKTKRLFPPFLFNLMASTTTLERRW